MGSNQRAAEGHNDTPNQPWPACRPSEAGHFQGAFGALNSLLVSNWVGLWTPFKISQPQTKPAPNFVIWSMYPVTDKGCDKITLEPGSPVFWFEALFHSRPKDQAIGSVLLGLHTWGEYPMGLLPGIAYAFFPSLSFWILHQPNFYPYWCTGTNLDS
jgi:hypothetical protein